MADQHLEEVVDIVEPTSTPPAWLGFTPTGHELETMPGEWFTWAIDHLEDETVPENYWRKVIDSGQWRRHVR
jgi:hypothetical protein